MKSISLVLILLMLAARVSLAATDDDPLKRLHIVNSKYYEIHTDLDKELMDELVQRMDVMFEQYQKAFSEFKLPADQPPLTVFLFRRHDSYMGFTRLAGTNTGGMFVPGPLPYLTSFLEGQGRDELRKTLQHEAFHQFAYYAISKHIPTWLNEGLASDFEEGIWTGKNFVMGQIPPRRIRNLQMDVKDGGLVPFSDFLPITPEQWTQTLHSNLQKGTTYYNESWAITYYVREVERGDNHNRYLRFLRKLHQGEEQTQAFKETLGQDVKGFQRRFEQWAIGMTPSAEATLIERDSAMGDLIELLAATKDQHFKDLLSFRNEVMKHGYTVNYDNKRMKWQAETNPANYFCDLGGQPYALSDLYFKPTPGAPFPDIICRATYQLQVRTHFYKSDQGVEHEVLVEPAKK
jgi:hypothetical protein